MAKDKLSDYDGVTAGNNTDIGGISIDEGMYPSTVNNSLRELTKQLGAFADGTDGIDVLNLHDDDASASIKIQAPATVTTTTTLTLPDGAGSNGQVLTTNGSGTLSWSTAGGISDIVEDTTPQLGGNLDTNGNDITFGDNDKAIFGAGSDLQIYHDGLNSYIYENGSGSLRVRATEFDVQQLSNGNSVIKSDGSSAQLLENGTLRLETTASGIDVTGTVTADNATLNGTSATLNVNGVGDGFPTLKIQRTSGVTKTNQSYYYRVTSGGELVLVDETDSNKNRFRLAQSGDISFYDSTGVTQGLYWDASTQRLGLGTTSPTSPLHVETTSQRVGTFISTGADPQVYVGDAASSDNAFILGYDRADNRGYLTVAGDSDSVFTIANGGNVGIGTSPTQKLHVDATGSTTAALFDNNGTNGDVVRVAKNGTDILKIRAEGTADLALDASGGSFIFKEGGTEAMRLDSSGRLGLGTSVPTELLHIREDGADASILVRTQGATAGTYHAAKLQFELGATASATRDWDIVADDPSNNGGYLGVEYEGSEKFRITAGGVVDIKKQIDQATLPNTPSNHALTFYPPITTGYFGGGISWSEGTNTAASINAVDAGSGGALHLAFSTGSNTAINEAMRITNGGTVQIDNGGELRIHRTGAGYANAYAGIQMDAGETIIYKNSWNNKDFRFTRDGDLLVGKTSSAFGTAGGEIKSNGQITGTASSAAAGQFNRLTSDGTVLNFARSGSSVGSISVTTSGTTYNTTSDIRLKTDIAPISDATDKLMAMNAVTHKWKSDPDADAVVGFIAQEMAEIVPEAVSKGDGEDDMWSMDYGRITPVLVAALQDAHKKIEQLEQRIADMEAK